MEIAKGIEIKGKALWIRKHKVLVIGDLHIGYEEALEKQGIAAPRRAFGELKQELSNLLVETSPKKVIINGDLKHEFGEISKQEWSETMDILNMIRDHCDEIVLVRGNHDKILEPIATRMGLKIVNSYFLEEIEKKEQHDISIDSICFLHGDKIISNVDTKRAKILIIGHEHAAIGLREGEKVEKYKCFLIGKWKDKKLIVLPSFFSLIEGTDVNNERLLSPYLHQDIGNFEVYVVGDQTYHFGSLKKIK
ncbi:MAG: metallophosphoesterase [Nanoarchaeota archaeon]|nr:metallophosphoesterase [Nanoarchaeota archaeon]